MRQCRIMRDDGSVRIVCSASTGATARFPGARALSVSSSGKALLVKLEDREEPVWIPMSQIHDDSEVYGVGDEGDLVTTEWIAREKGLI